MDFHLIHEVKYYTNSFRLYYPVLFYDFSDNVILMDL